MFFSRFAAFETNSKIHDSSSSRRDKKEVCLDKLSLSLSLSLPIQATAHHFNAKSLT
jgi:hypothetical protein